ncbi:transglutaminase family protein [Alishewanella sp. HL-SH05]|uniref:transglutaminase family protein n=1 Tax=Alishewanella sp. HL-SH05 TaxID=3461145 RepID=UPI0040431614
MLMANLALPRYWAVYGLLLQVLLFLLYQPALSIASSLLFALLLTFQAWRLYQNKPALSNRQINVLLAPLLLLMLLQVWQLGVLNLMLHILLLAAVARSLTVQQRGQGLQLLWVHYFAIACCFIFYQQMSMAILIFALALLNLYLQYRLFAPAESTLQPKRLMSIFALSCPLWLGMFLLFPRLPPLWQLPNQNMASTGLGDELDPGSIEKLVQSDALAFRVSFLNERPDKADWYWRAKVYEDFDGRRWQVNARFDSRQRRAMVTELPAFSASAPLVKYQILAESSYQTDLFSLGLPVSWQANLVAKPAALMASQTPLTQRISYSLQSRLQAVPLTSPAEKQLNLLQDNANPKARAFGAALATQFPAQPDKVVQALSAYFQQEPFFYTLTPPRLGQNAIDQFLYETRSGFCSHYASATAVILRAAGIPARVVGGYLGGNWQENQQYLQVRQRDAHAWVEYLTASGWQRYDPTAAIAPERILEGIEQTLSDNERALLSGWQDNWLGQLALQWSHLDYVWSVWVLGFNQQDQEQLWQRLRRWEYWSVLLYSLGALLLLGAAVMLRQFVTQRADHAHQAWRWLTQALGTAPAAGCTLSSWLTTLAEQNPAQQQALERLRKLYEAAVFNDDAAALRLLRRELRLQRRSLRRLVR